MVATTTPAVKVLSVCGETHPAHVWQRALDRAHAEGVQVFHKGGEWFATSVSEPGTLHAVNGHCDCKGAERGLLCKHTAAVRTAQVEAGLLVACDFCGQVGPVDQMHRETRHVGGQDDRQVWYCGEGFGHQASR